MHRFLPVLLLAACASYPEVDARVSPAAERAPFPALLSLDVIDGRAAGVTITDRDAAIVAARAAQLAARARILRGAPVTDETRARLAAL